MKVFAKLLQGSKIQVKVEIEKSERPSFLGTACQERSSTLIK